MPRVIGQMNEMAKNRFEWKIPEFSSLYRSSTIVFLSPSSIFMNRSFHLRICKPVHSYDKLSVYLENGCKFEIDLSILFSIKHRDGTLFGIKTAVDKSGGTYGITDFMHGSLLRRTAFELLPDDILTIVCDLKTNLKENQTISLAGEASNLKEKSVVTVEQHPETHETRSSDIKEHIKLIETDLLCKNLKDLLNDKDSCDAVLLVQGKEYKVHKFMLIARSSVFAAMFQHDTTEKHTGRVTIPDCDPDSFQKFLEYVYCGRLENISSDSALHLYYTSDKYNMQEFKAFCIKYLMHNLTLQNICDVISFADKYDETSLLSAAQEFFNKNLEEILMSREWEDLFKNNFRLANRLLVEMSKSKK